MFVESAEKSNNLQKIERKEIKMTKIILKPESSSREYKKAKNKLPKDFWKTYSAFSNTNGGLVVLGISEDDKGNFSITGIEDVEKIKKDLFTTLRDDTKISFNSITESNVNIRCFDDKLVLEILVLEAPIYKKPVYLNNDIKNTYKRLNDGDHRATTEELKNMIRNAEDDLDSHLLSNYDINDLNKNSIENYRRLLIGNNEESAYVDMSIKNLLIDVGAMKRNRENLKEIEYKLTIGGLLFFGKYSAITEYLPHFHLDYFNRTGSSDRWSDRVASGDPNYPDLNLFSFYQIVLDKLRMTIHEPFELTDDYVRKSSTEDVGIALREALANSLIHADYFCKKSVRVEAYRGFYIFENPGEMKVSVEEFIRGGDSQPRNHTVTTLFRRAGLCERAGTGGPKIVQSATKNKFKMPDIISRDEKTCLKIWKIDLAESHPELTKEEKAIYKCIMKVGYSISHGEIQEKTGLSRYYVAEGIKVLISKNLIIQEGRARATRYALVEGTSEKLAQLQHIMKSLEDYYIK